MTDIIIPNLGNEISEAEITEWLVGIGEEVEEGDVVLLISTTKTFAPALLKRIEAALPLPIPSPNDPPPATIATLFSNPKLRKLSIINHIKVIKNIWNNHK